MYHTQRWTLDKIRRRLELIKPLEYIKSSPLPAFRYKDLESPLASPPIAPDVDDSQWTEAKPNDYWGTWFTDFALRTIFTVPADWDSSSPVALYLPLGESGEFSHPEALAYLDGLPFAACDRHHQEILLQSEWADGKPHTLVLHGWTGLGGLARGDYLTKLYLRPCSIVQIHQPTRDFIALARVAHETAEILDDNNPAKHGLLNALNDAFNALETRDPLGDSFYSTVATAISTLKKGITKAGAPLDVTIHATGHSHIDVAWLWTLGHTRRKTERTFFTVLHYMDQFPDYHFSQSQPQLYEFIHQDQPQLFASIQERIKDGRWEPMGGMWVEADCNLSGAESLARQLLLGRSYFRQHFGKDAETPVLWLPDVFGYAWALPQLIQQAGLKYFMTTKIGWNQYNRLPFDTFLWQGLDGTRILTHFSTATDFESAWTSTYNAMARAKESLGTWQNFQQKELQRDLLMSYGYGDGGGGPTREMLENIAVMGEMPGLPRVKQSSVRQFFETIASLADDQKMPVWNGELYLEYHRGTYTTQARNKRLNRKCEFLLHDTEFLATVAACLDPAYTYPTEKFTAAWQTICLNQFHDIIPGSSIAPVYKESQAQYAEVAGLISKEQEQTLSALSGSLGGDLLIVNPTSYTRSDLAFLPGELPGGLLIDGKAITLQPVEGGCLINPGELPPYSLTPGFIGPSSDRPTPKPDTWDLSLENDLLKVQFSPTGDITRIFDKAAGREVLASGRVGNLFQAFEDRPKDNDAWDIDIYYDDKTYYAEPASSVRLVECGPLRWTVEVKRKILNSAVTQRISLRHNSPRLDFDTAVNWIERHILLKVAFPVEVFSPAATYEIQWGNIQRPTHRNTSWDWARFESCAYKWVDLSEGGYGVSLLNDCKYGHDIQDNIMRLTLLRSPSLPDPMADYGEHYFIYSLLPHAGSWENVTQREAYALNDPIIVSKGEANKPETQLRGVYSLVSVSEPNMVIETIKRAEDGDGIIIRLYESHRKRGEVEVRCAFEIAGAWLTNLLEENETALRVEDHSIYLSVKPYQIFTLRVRGNHLE